MIDSGTICNNNYAICKLNKLQGLFEDKKMKKMTKRKEVFKE